MRILSEQINDLGDEISGNIDKIKLGKSSGRYTKKERLGISEDMLFDSDVWTKRLRGEISPEVKALIRSIVIKEARKYNIEYIETEWARTIAKAVEQSTAKISDSIGTIKNELTELIDTEIKRNPAPQTQMRENLKGLIKEKFQTLSTSRANLIAQTTATNASGNAIKQSSEKLELDTVWLSRRDGRVRPTHFAADGKKPDANGLFNIGGDLMPYPAAGSTARENAGCRCYLFSQKRSG